MDSFYDTLSNIIKYEMSIKLNKRVVHIVFCKSKKRHRLLKPWWNDHLQLLWYNMCEAEKKWVVKTGIRKKYFKQLFVLERCKLDKAVQKCKRQYWIKMQNDLILMQRIISLIFGRTLVGWV